MTVPRYGPTHGGPRLTDETVGWNINPYGDSWRITTVDGDLVADDIPHGELAHYIADMHNTTVRKNRGFRVGDMSNIHTDDGFTDKQCNETAHPYRCAYGEGHTGPHVTYGTLKTYLFD